MKEIDTTLRRDVPPPINVTGHLRALRAVLPAALIIALIVGGLVAGARALFTPKQYEATLVTQVRPGGTVMPGDVFVEQLRAPFIALSKDQTVLSQVLATVHTGWDTGALQSHLGTAAGTSPDILYFTATGDSPQQAKDLVRSLVVTIGQAAVANHNRDTAAVKDELKAAIAAEQAHFDALPPGDPAKAKADAQLNDLRAQLARVEVDGSDQLTILASPENSAAPVAPHPFSEGLIAFLVTLFIAAEVLVLLRSRIGDRINDPWAQRISTKYGANYETVAEGGSGLPPLAAAAVAYQLDEGRKVLVLLGDEAAVDRDSIATSSDAGDRLVTLSSGEHWWDKSDLSGTGVAVLAVTQGSEDRDATTTALAQLRDLNLSTYLVLQENADAPGDAGRFGFPRGLSMPSIGRRS